MPPTISCQTINQAIDCHSVEISRVKNTCLAMPKDFWSTFQLYLRENRLPNLIVEILKKTGYDSPLSIELLEDDKIKGIEESIQKRFNSFNQLFKDTEYENIETFEFLPGHKTLLLGIRIYVKKYLEKNLSAKRNNRLPAIVEECSETELELFSDIEKENLKKKLIEKVEKFSKKFNISTESLSQNNIRGDLDAIIKADNHIVYKCKFHCSIGDCQYITPCLYNKHWQISNLEKHLKTHIETTRRPNKAILSALDNILRPQSTDSSASGSCNKTNDNSITQVNAPINT